jgi:hypothetical protein
MIFYAFSGQNTMYISKNSQRNVVDSPLKTNLSMNQNEIPANQENCSIYKTLQSHPNSLILSLENQNSNNLQAQAQNDQQLDSMTSIGLTEVPNTDALTSQSSIIEPNNDDYLKIDHVPGRNYYENL